MTPELTLQPDHSVRTPLGAGHLTEEQFGELLAASARTAADPSPAEAHLRSCAQCTAELDGLRECLLVFREASTAYANNELRHMPQVKLPARRRMIFPVMAPVYWAAAAAVLLAAFLPIQTLRRHETVTTSPVVARTAAAPAAASESDEALLDDVSREESASVPAPMQALADPTAGAASTSSGIEISTPTSN